MNLYLGADIAGPPDLLPTTLHHVLSESDSLMASLLLLKPHPWLPHQKFFLPSKPCPSFKAQLLQNKTFVTSVLTHSTVVRFLQVPGDTTLVETGTALQGSPAGAGGGQVGESAGAL